ncbi:MAG: L,D-transpeptidase family protein [Myxococcota bacterium]
MPPAARSLLVVLMSVSACFRVGEPRSGSAAPAVTDEPTELTAPSAAAVEAPAAVDSTIADLEAAVHAPIPTLRHAEADVEALGEPEPAREVLETVELMGHANVRAEPRLDAPALGMVALGGRVDVYAHVEGEGCRKGWLEIAPRGYICAKTQATRRSADGILPEVPDGARVPGVYGSVAKDALVYANLDAALRGDGQAPGRHLTVRRGRAVNRDGQSFWKTRYGLIRDTDVRRLKGTAFHGEILDDGLTQPLAWTLPGPDDKRVHKVKTVAVFAAADEQAQVVAQLPARRARLVLEERDGFVRVDEGWIAQDRVRIARRTTPPTEVGEHERWLDIDLSQQVLVAYEGIVPVYATLISSGRPGHRTPTGIFRISRKVAERTMNSMADSADSYSVDKVPWTAYFATGYALHAAFWHGGFGRTRSHGCVNLAPHDARALYDWMAPAAAPGWAEVFGHEAQPGSLVRMRSRKDPEPQWKGYARQMHEAPHTEPVAEPVAEPVVVASAR